MVTSSSAIKSVAKYTLLPGFWPRCVALVPRFSLIAYFMALIFETVRLLPSGHPLLDPARIETYRVRDVMAAAAHNLRGGFRNSDHYIIFGMFVIGIVLLLVQFVIVATMIVVSAAHAAGATTFSSIFVTNIPYIDIAHLMLDRVFGIPEFFKSCYDPAYNGQAVCEKYPAMTPFPTPFQVAMQWLFKFYNFGMLAVAGFIMLYYVFAMFVETVNTGRPFGNRFQSFYTPFRLVLAVLLMLPLAYGYSTGQYVVLWSAKFGSAMATNSWYLFNKRVGDNPLGLQPHQLVGAPKVQDIESIINFFYLVHSCKEAYAIAYPNKNIQPYLVRRGGTRPAAAQMLGGGGSFAAARDFYGQADVKIVFGDQKAIYTKYPSNVKPYCGAVSIPTLSKQVGDVDQIYEVYYNSILAMWNDGNMAAYGKRMACNLRFAEHPSCAGLPGTAVAWDAAADAPAGQNFYINMRLNRQALYTAQMDAAITGLRNANSVEKQMDAELLLHGWGGAGMWFNKLVSYNGALVDSLMILPSPTQYPMIMEHIAFKKTLYESNVQPLDRFSPRTASGEDGTTMDYQIDDADLDRKVDDLALGNLLHKVYQEVQGSEATAKPRAGGADNFAKRWVTLLFADSGLLNFQANGEVFPLFKLTMLGREIIDKTIIMMVGGHLLSGMGGLLGEHLGAFKGIVDAVGGTLTSFATMGILAGITLYYVVPFMPFIYFFFAVGRWVKSIFEAMIAIPLWAMAHLRLGGEGIPGSAASAGYFLILEICLRPILSLFGFLSAIAVFGAMAVALDSIFSLLVMNVSGFDMTLITSGNGDDFAAVARDGLDALFYTIIYVILIYMMANSSFKLIDIFPNTVMRWAGTGASAFNDQSNVEQQLDVLMVQKVRQVVETINKSGDSVATKLGKMNMNTPGK